MNTLEMNGSADLPVKSMGVARVAILYAHAIYTVYRGNEVRFVDTPQENVNVAVLHTQKNDI